MPRAEGARDSKSRANPGLPFLIHKLLQVPNPGFPGKKTPPGGPRCRAWDGIHGLQSYLGIFGVYVLQVGIAAREPGIVRSNLHSLLPNILEFTLLLYLCRYLYTFSVIYYRIHYVVNRMPRAETSKSRASVRKTRASSPETRAAGQVPPLCAAKHTHLHTDTTRTAQPNHQPPPPPVPFSRAHAGTMPISHKNSSQKS